MPTVRKINFSRALGGLSVLLVLALQGQSAAFAQPLYPRAPEVIPGTLPEMRTVDFWVARMESPDEVILTLAEIWEMNEAYQQKMGDIPSFVSGLDEDMAEQFNTQLVRSPGLVAIMPNIGTKPPFEISATVNDLVRRQIQNLEGRQYGNRLAVEYSAAQIKDLVDEVHKKTACLLEKQYDVVILTNFGVKDMTKRERRKINRKTTSDMLTWAHARFR